MHAPAPHPRAQKAIRARGSQCGQPIKLARRPAEFNRNVTAFDKTSIVQALANRGNVFIIGLRCRSQDDNDRHRSLSARCEWPIGGGAEQYDEVPPLHSMTSSARASSVSGI